MLKPHFLARLFVPICLLAAVGCTVTVQGSGPGNGNVLISQGNVTCSISSGVGDPNCTQDIGPGTTITLTASPETGSVFNGWTSGCDTVVTNVCTLTTDKLTPYTPTASFGLISGRLLTVAGSGLGSGSTLSSVGSATCTITAGATSGTCQQTVPDGTTVTLTPTASAGSVFNSWTGCDSVVTNVCSATMNAAKGVTASFNLVTRALTIAGSGAGNGSTLSSFGSATCTITAGVTSGTCQQTVPDGTTVTLTPTASAGSAFNSWTGCDSVATNVCSVTMNAAKGVTASFGLVRVLTVTGGGLGNGSTLSSVGSATCTITAGVTSGTCQQTVPDGTTVTLTPTASAGSVFNGWTGCDSVATNVCSVTMSAAKGVTASFGLVRVLTVTGGGLGSGSTLSSVGSATCTITAGVTSGTCQQTVPDGTTVTLTPTASAGSAFNSWTGCDSVATNVCSVTMNAAKGVTASFDVQAQADPQLSIDPPTISGANGGLVTVTYSGFVPGTASATLTLTGPGPCAGFPTLPLESIPIPDGVTGGSFSFPVSPGLTAYIGCALTVQITEGGKQASASLTIT